MFSASTSNKKEEVVTGQDRGQNVHLRPWNDKQFELKCPNWKLWAYTDGSCIGTGVYCPQAKAECYVNSGGVGMTNTINGAELTLQQRLPISIPRLQRTLHAP